MTIHHYLKLLPLAQSYGSKHVFSETQVTSNAKRCHHIHSRKENTRKKKWVSVIYQLERKVMFSVASYTLISYGERKGETQKVEIIWKN